MKKVLLEFEKPIYELYDKIGELKKLTETQDVDMSNEITKMEKRAKELEKKIFDDLSPMNILQIARHQQRPTTLDYVNLIFNDFIELKGDRLFADDPAMVGGFCKYRGKPVMVIGHQKGKDTKDNIHRNFGMAQPEGYRKALRLMKLAEKFKMPIITFVDTPGAYPGIGAEERGQAEAIARNLREMTNISVPIMAIITGEGGSGGALGIAVANKVWMLQYAVYSVISPEGCASILWRDATKADLAADSMKITAKDLLELKVVDGIITEPDRGAHEDYDRIAKSIGSEIEKFLDEHKSMSAEEVKAERYQKFRKMGFFTT